MKTSRNNWTDEELEFLQKNYKSKGAKFVAEQLIRHSYASITKKAQRYGLVIDQSIYHYNESEVRNIVTNSFSYKEVLRKLGKTASGESYQYLIRYIKRNMIDTSHFDPWRNNGGRQNSISIQEWLQNGTTIGSNDLKKRLYKEGLKHPICELCGQDEWWHGKRMSLILDHINGINNDNRLENLRIVCPNCEGTLETHCRGNTKKCVRKA